jgi:peptide/nickel transport system substrate-binding protein
MKKEVCMSKLKELENMFTQGKLTRREFMARVSALGLMAAVSPALLGGKAEAATPKVGGKFILGSAGGSTTDSLDPGTLAHTMPQCVNQALRTAKPWMPMTSCIPSMSTAGKTPNRPPKAWLIP